MDNKEKIKKAEELMKHMERLVKIFKGDVPVALVLDGDVSVQIEGCFIVYVDYRETETDTILGTEKKMQFFYDIVRLEYNRGVHMYPDGTGEPPSWEEHEICTKESTTAAAGEVVGLYADMMINDICQAIEEDKMFRDEEEMYKQMAEDASP